MTQAKGDVAFLRNWAEVDEASRFHGQGGATVRLKSIARKIETMIAALEEVAEIPTKCSGGHYCDDCDCDRQRAEKALRECGYR